MVGIVDSWIIAHIFVNGGQKEESGGGRGDEAGGLHRRWHYFVADREGTITRLAGGGQWVRAGGRGDDAAEN